MFNRVAPSRLKDMLLLTGLLGFFILGFYTAVHLFTSGKNQTFILGEEDFASSYAASASGPRLDHVTSESIPLQEEGSPAFYFTSPNEILVLPKRGDKFGQITISSYNLLNKQMSHGELKAPSNSVFYSEGYFIGIDMDNAFLQNSEDPDDYKFLFQELYFKARLGLLMDAGVQLAGIQEERITDASFDRDTDSLYLSAQYNNRTSGLFQYQMETGTLKLLAAEAYIDAFQVLSNHNILYQKPGGLFLLDVNSGGSQQIVEAKVLNFSVSADGQNLAYAAINDRGVTELYGMHMDQRQVKQMREHSMLYSNLSNVQALAWVNDRLLCLSRQPTGSYQLYRFTLKNE
ncbi:TolB-like translocation protein [Paenibacillus jiagnxiensis]|uniref:hypothetical protein n=1 Tax=Paenibacillus jiagnxiensis TaxID=3228926 RepID=UPI0033BF80DD